MPHSSLACVGLSAMSFSVELRPMWHSTQFTRACPPTLWAAISSGCTAWHIVAQNALLLEYSQPAMPAAPTTASPTIASTIPVTEPSISVLRPMRIFIVLHSSGLSSAGASIAPLPYSRGAGRTGPDSRIVMPPAVR